MKTSVSVRMGPLVTLPQGHACVLWVISAPPALSPVPGDIQVRAVDMSVSVEMRQPVTQKMAGVCVHLVTMETDANLVSVLFYIRLLTFVKKNCIKNAECILYHVILLILNRMWWKQFWQGLQWKLQLFWKWSLWPGDRSMSLWPWLDGGQVRSAVSFGKVWAGLCPLLCVSEQWVMWPSERMLQLPARVLWTELWIQYATLLP